MHRGRVARSWCRDQPRWRKLSANDTEGRELFVPLEIKWIKEIVTEKN